MDLSVLLAAERMDDSAAEGVHPSEASEFSGIHKPTSWKKHRRPIRHVHSDSDDTNDDIPISTAAAAWRAAGASQASPVLDNNVESGQIRLRSVLPAEYIFPPNQSRMTKCPVHAKPTTQSKRISTICLNQRFMVMRIHNYWALVHLQGDLKGWAPMTCRGRFHLVPVTRVQQSRQFGTKQPSSKKSTNGTMSAVSMFFGIKSNDRSASKKSASSRKEKCAVKKSPSTSAVGVQDQEKPHQMYSWQRERGKTEDYSDVLEARRQALRNCDLSTDPIALNEWMELIRELDVVTRHKFSTKISPQNDVRKPRSNSFLDVSSSSFSSGEDSSLPSTSGRRRSNSFVSMQVTPPTKSTAVSSRVDFEFFAAATSSSYANTQNTKNQDIEVCESSKSTLSSTHGDESKNTTEKTSTGAGFLAESTPNVKIERKMCKHGGDPATCKYGSCAVNQNNGEAPEQTFASKSKIPASKLCKHGNQPETCKYGTCPLMEKMVQEEITRIKQLASSGDGSGSKNLDAGSAIISSGPECCDLSSTCAGPTNDTQLPSANDAMVLKELNATPRSEAPVDDRIDSPSGLSLTGGRRVMKKRIKNTSKRSSATQNLVRKVTSVGAAQVSNSTKSENADNASSPASAESPSLYFSPSPRRVLFTPSPDGSKPKETKKDIVADGWL